MVKASKNAAEEDRWLFPIRDEPAQDENQSFTEVRISNLYQSKLPKGEPPTKQRMTLL